MKSKHLTGILLAILGSSLWGVSGPASTVLFNQGVAVAWLISSKMLIAGIVTLGYAAVKTPRLLTTPWRTRKDALQMVVFVLFGMIAMQFVYFKAVAVANAPTATILQYLSPIVVLVVLAVKTLTLPRRSDVVIIAFAMLGTLLIVTKGRLTTLAITPQALFWGLLAAVAAATYTLLPGELLQRHSPLVVTGWAQLLGGLLMTVWAPFWRQVPHLTAFGWGCYAFVVIGGTIVAYLVYLASLQYITPTAASLLDAFEPLAATVIAVLFLGTRLSGWELVGGLVIIGIVVAMALLAPKAPGESTAP
ncbi:DMT family transporter [Lacticaseibacillus parakribbianus]|uniref:DMT family transporter n=1 Tax=Lacticaseibacillus parakribbianus TaxID=2970927 RepID=UPI0021CAF5A9|nr:EamA family transporter [Lacticaseibacillus parakribbianus]